ncbi:unnamed protein product [Tuber aestivum]|uniref:Uncharacterized protein n=1 Tax=Tuber aestivum TaxID=59557 RepID=A0A292PL83_9PEZI|nr:unnamed protein product [Tuber aestivum]
MQLLIFTFLLTFTLSLTLPLFPAIPSSSPSPYTVRYTHHLSVHKEANRMSIRNSETARHRWEIERIWRRLRARDHSSSPANYDTFTFRPGGQAAVVRNPFEKLSSDSFTAPIPTIAPRGFDNSKLNPSTVYIDQVYSSQAGQEKFYPRHAHDHFPISIPANSRITTDSREKSLSPQKPLQTGTKNSGPGEALGGGSRGQYEKGEKKRKLSGCGNYGSGRNLWIGA